MSPALKGTLAAGLACLWLAVPPAAAAAAPPDPGSGTSVKFRLAAGPSGPEEPALRPRPKKGRAWAELGVFAVAVTVQYWTSNSFPEDRDFRITFDDQITRVLFLDGWRFDSNQFSLNWSHILGGAMYYQFGRSNHLSWTYSWLMAFAGSTWWEVVGEPKEVIAINDQFMTGAGGFPLGEAWYQAGHFLLHRPRFLQRALGVINPVVLFNHWMDRKDPATKSYVQPGWHDFSLFAGARRLSSDGLEPGTDLYLGFHARFIGLPEYGRPGEVRRAVKDTYVSEMAFDYAARGGHAEETRLYAKAVPWGRFVQNIGDDGNGYSLTIGLGSSFEYFKKRPLADYDADPVPVKTGLERLRLEDPRAFTDKLAILHLAGPVLDWTAFRRGLKLRTVVEASIDFALVNATAINDYSRVHDITGLKTTVFYYGYYYGFGGTFAARASLDTKILELHGSAELNAWGSADFLDRFQDEITNNAHLTDTRARFLLGASLRVPHTPVELVAEIESVRRSGGLEEIRSVRRETKAYVGLAYSF